MQKRRLQFFLFAILLAQPFISLGQWTKLKDGYPSSLLLKDIHVNSTGQRVTAVGYDLANFQGNVFRSTNGGNAWDTVHVLPPGFLLTCIGFNGADTGFVGGFGSKSLWLRTVNSGNTWTYWAEDTLTTGVTDFYFVDGKHAFAGSYNHSQFTDGHCYYTANGGRDWLDQNVTTPSPLDSLALEQVDFPDVQTGYAHTAVLFATTGNILKTTDTGKHWTIAYHHPSTIEGIYFWTVNNGVMCDDNGHIFKTNDGGHSWVQKSTPSGISILSSITFKDNNNGYAVGYGGVILKSTDGGETWTRETSITTKDLLRVKFFNGMAYAVGSGGTVLRSGSGTGVSTVPIDYQVNVYPNPAGSILNISSSLKYPCKLLKVELSDLAGRVILQGQSDAGLIKLNTQTLPSGTYSLYIQADDKHCTQKILVGH